MPTTYHDVGVCATDNQRPLAQTLIEHGLALAAVGGPEAVSLREVQRRAGVSHYAAYRHFGGRPEFLRAVARRASAVMAERLRTAVTAVERRGSAPELARQRFAAWARSYFEFALDEPGLFAASFAAVSTRGIEEVRLDDDRPDADAAYDVFRERMEELVVSGALAATRRRAYGLTAWSAVHGLSTIVSDGPLSAYDEEARREALARVTETLIEAQSTEAP